MRRWVDGKTGKLGVEVVVLKASVYWHASGE